MSCLNCKFTKFSSYLHCRHEKQLYGIFIGYNPTKPLLKFCRLTFSYCSKLTEILVDSENQNYSSIDGVLYSKDKTTLIQVPGGKSGEVIIPDAVTTVEEYAFINCKGLTSVTIGKSVTLIRSSAFAGCVFKEINMLKPEPPTEVWPSVFSNYSATLYVPEGSLSVYRETSPWNMFENIIEKTGSGINDVNTEESSEVVVYNLHGVRMNISTREELSTLLPGLYIVNGRKVVVK